MQSVLARLFVVCLVFFSLGLTSSYAEQRLDAKALQAALGVSGTVVLIRHSATFSGIGDPENFRLEDCSTQRNLSPEGRAQARAFGQWFRDRGLTPSAVRSSQWCRCLDTATEALVGGFRRSLGLRSIPSSRAMAIGPPSASSFFKPLPTPKPLE